MPHPRRVPRDKPSDSPNLRITALAERQHGAVATRQLQAAGLAPATIADWVRGGRLHPRHRGVYVVGHARLSDEGRLWAAHLATGAPFDGITSAWAWRILPPQPDPLHIVSATRKRSTRTLRTRTRTPLPAVVNLRGLPTLNLTDTLERLPKGLRQRAAANAAYAGLRTRRPQETESPLAEKLLVLIKRAGVPEPKTELRVLGKRRDFVWPGHRLIVEADGRRAHENPFAFEDDRRRDGEALAAGWRTVRFTREQIERDPAYVIATLRALLSV